MKLAANLGYLFTELPFLERFGAAAKAGFSGVEIIAADVYPIDQLAETIGTAGVQFVQFNTAIGNWKAGERGISVDPEKRGEFQDAIGQALEFSSILGNKQIHIMSGIVQNNNKTETARRVLVENLKFAAEAFSKEGIRAQIEPINNIDVPGYFLCQPKLGVEIIKEVGHENLYLQYDIYHAQMTEGDLAESIRKHIKMINHIQIAQVPGRHEPDNGEINYPYLFDVIEEVGYQGWVSCEYKPFAETLSGLTWARPYGVRG
jgi:hydroxypyruvate isomerase